MMALSMQNKNFLSHLHKLDIDLNQFSDKTFDGLFDNVPDNVNYFFNWFIDNVTPANVLTKLEELMYFEMVSNDLLPTEKETNHILLNHQPPYEELNDLDADSVKTILPRNLKDLEKIFEKLVDNSKALELIHNKICKISINDKEKMNIAKKQLLSAENDCFKGNLLLNKKADNIQTFILLGSNFQLNSKIYQSVLMEEKAIFQKIKSKILNCQTVQSYLIPSIPKLEENLSNAGVALIVSKGLYQLKQTEFKFFEEVLQNLLNDFDSESPKELEVLFKNSICDNTEFQKKLKKIKILELELFMKQKKLSKIEVEKITNSYYLGKKDKNVFYKSKLLSCLEHINLNNLKDAWLSHILLKYVLLLEEVKLSKKECITKLNQHEILFYNNFKNFELKNKKFEELCSRLNDEQFMMILKDSLNIDFNIKNKMFKISSIFQLMTDSVNDACHKELKTAFQSFVNTIMNKVFCGPTSEIMNIPVELLINFHKCELLDKKLSKEIKRLVNDYLEIKQAIAKSDRKNMLLWTNFLNADELQTHVETL